MLLLFDFSKAFDSVCHVTLLQKLRDVKLSNTVIKWFASYLANREQAVLDTDGNPSSYAPLNIGVPQGSVLGPLPFCLYMNNISDDFHDPVSYLVYADDLQMYIKFPLTEMDNYVGILSRLARLVARWAEDNYFKLNVKNKVDSFLVPIFILIN